MTDKLVQWIRDLTIRRKLLSGIAIVLALNAYLALYAINRLSAVGAVAKDPVADQIVSDTRGAILVLVLITIGIGITVALLLGTADRRSLHRARPAGRAGGEGRPHGGYPQRLAR